MVSVKACDNDLVVNVTEVNSSQTYAAGSDENIIYCSTVLKTEQAIDYIQDDELIEITPDSIRMRKRYLTENERKRASSKA